MAVLPDVPYRLNCIGFEELTVSTAAVTMTPVAGAIAAYIYYDVADVRVRLDGTAPTATIGMYVPYGSYQTFEGSAMNNAQFIRAGGSDATLYIHYFGRA